VCDAQWPSYDENYLKEDSKKYAISFNGKVRFSLDFPAEMGKEEVEKLVMNNEQVVKILDGKQPKKVIVVPGKIVNIVF